MNFTIFFVDYFTIMAHVINFYEDYNFYDVRKVEVMENYYLY